MAKFSEETIHILKQSKIEMQKLKHAFIGSEHLILSILNDNNKVCHILNNHGINYDNFRNKLIKTIGLGKCINNYFVYTPLLKRILEESIITAKESNSKVVSLNILFSSLLDEGEGVGIRVLHNLGLNIDQIYDELNIKNSINYNKKLLISECGLDLTKQAKNNLFDPLIGRENEVNELIEIIVRRNKNNPLLIGEAGVGKTAIVEELARRIIKGDVPDKLKNTRIISLSMANCVSGTKYRGEFEERITKIIKELEENKELIVFIDEIHTLVGAGGAEGAIDASNILKPALARGNIRVIGATTINEYKDSISKDKALNRRFQTILINENTVSETKEILKKLKNIYEEYHQVIISDNIIDELVELVDKYIVDRKNPDKSLDILDSVCTKVSLKKDKWLLEKNKLNNELYKLNNEKHDLIKNHHYTKATIIHNKEMELESLINKLSLRESKIRKRKITIKDIASVLEKKTNIPIYEVNHNLIKINKLEKYLNSRIIGQENVIYELSCITQRIIMGMNNSLPYSILFIGKSGVGKTMLVKEYSKYMNIPLIRLDMGEYNESHSISKIIGTSPGYVGYNDYNNVLEKVRNNPYSIILLDEIDKAHHDVISLFFSILDDGEILDSHGNKVNFKNTIIVMTGNIGLEKDAIGFNNAGNNDVDIRNILSTSFVNRINKICYFNNLNDEQIKKIINNKIKELMNKYKKYGVKLNISNEIISNIISKSDYYYYGARKVNKLLEDEIDNIVINKIIDNKKTIKIS